MQPQFHTAEPLGGMSLRELDYTHSPRGFTLTEKNLLSTYSNKEGGKYFKVKLISLPDILVEWQFKLFTGSSIFTINVKINPSMTLDSMCNYGYAP